MDIAEDRGRFSDMLKEMDIPYPDHTGRHYDVDEAVEVANKVGYPGPWSGPVMCWAVSACGSSLMIEEVEKCGGQPVETSSRK